MRKIVLVLLVVSVACGIGTVWTAAQEKPVPSPTPTPESKANGPEDSRFALVFGVGSLIVGTGVTDYQNKSNIIQSSNFGRATPQFLTGVALRTEIPNFRGVRGPEDWQKHPWSAFVSLKFSPEGSETINGYVLGGAWAFSRYASLFGGYSLTPINEPSAGFQRTAALFVETQQAQGQYLNFDPAAMLRNTSQAFDGFPLTDPNGKLIYQGNPLTVHYHGGFVVGVLIPVNFKSAFGASSASSQNGSAPR